MIVLNVGNIFDFAVREAESKLLTDTSQGHTTDNAIDSIEW